MKELEYIMHGNYTEKDLLIMYKLKLLSLENTKENQKKINYYKYEIKRLTDDIEEKSKGKKI